ncbi:MAG: dephospho-CoA kinase [bacterium]|jgi:dephospho-CoA kinase
MIRVGITGGIGTGKSTVCKIFASMGIPVLDADSLAKNIAEIDQHVKQQILEVFGAESYDDQDKYNRKFIASIVFNDAEKLKMLNNIIHPAVIDYSNNWAEQHLDKKYVVKEAALMFESGSYKYNDINIVVNAPKELRIQRILSRDNSSIEDIIRRIESQMSDEERNSMADKIIVNDEHNSLIAQVYSLHQEFVK